MTQDGELLDRRRQASWLVGRRCDQCCGASGRSLPGDQQGAYPRPARDLGRVAQLNIQLSPAQVGPIRRGMNLDGDKE